MKRFLAWFLTLILVLGMVSLPGMTKAEGEENPDPSRSVEQIVHEEEVGSEAHAAKAPWTKDGQYYDIASFNMAVGETKQLETTLMDAVWGSDDETILTVDENHVVTARSVGHAYIWAYGYDNELGFDVTHQWEVTVTQLTLSADALELPLGGSGALTASYYSVFEYYTIVSEDVTARCTWSWTGNDPAIASFDETTGTVTASDEQYGAATLTAAYTPEEWDHPLLASCTVTVKAATNDYPPPTITAQPKDVTVKSGAKAKFAVKVKEKGVSYQWYARATEADEWAAVDGETKAELKVIGTKENMNSQYRCLVSTAEGGTVYTDIAALSVILQPPVIRTQPKGATVKSAATAKISVKASGKNLTYTWFTRAAEGEDWIEIDGAAKADYSFAATMAHNGSQYYCRVENPDGAVDSDVATLTVTPQPASVKTQPKDAKVKSGAKAKFKVSASGPNLQYQWFTRPTEADEWTEVDGAVRAECSIAASMAKNGSQYFCRVWNDDGSADSGVVTLTVTPQPLKISTQPKDVRVKSGAKAKFKVSASGPNLQYQWFTRPTETDEWIEVDGAVKAEYSFTAKLTQDGSQYCCKVWNDDETLTSASATLTVTPQPIVIKTQPKDVSVKSGAEAKFTIKASGPNLSYQWFVRTAEDADWELINGAVKHYYTVKASDVNNGWQFYCCVYNMDEEVSSDIAALTLK